MKILQLCKKYPYPVKDGEALAVINLSRGLHALGCELHLLTMNTAKHYFAEGQRPKALAHYAEVESVQVDNRLKLRDAAINLFSRESYHVSRYRSDAFRKALRRRLRQTPYDLVQLETLYLTPYLADIRAASSAPVVLRAHNVESEIWQRMAGQMPAGPKAWYLRHLAGKLEAYERRHLGQADLLAPISERDLGHFGRMGFRGKACVTPIGVQLDAYRPDFSSFQRPLTLGFIGSLDWMPNLEGLRWFLRAVWPRLRRAYPALELHVAGRNTPGWLRNRRQPGLVVHGEVEDARAFINRHSVLVVPLLSGSGMRAKIIEAMALGKVVLSTGIGLEGIPARHQQEALRADRPEEFVEALAYCLNQNGQLLAMGKRARRFAERRYARDRIARNLLEALDPLAVKA